MSEPTSATAGYKTSEFWMSLVATLLGFLMASGALDGADENSWIVRIVGGVVALLSGMGYTAARAKVKAADAA